jgi:lipopolysaccharide export system protein LptA
MTPEATRWLRRGLLGLGAAVGVAVVASVRQPAPAPQVAAREDRPAPGATPVTRMGDLVYRYLKGERESFVVRAKSTVGTEQDGLGLREVEVEFAYTYRGEPASGTIRADECFYQPGRQLARFRGNVRLRTADGFELDGEALDYDAAEGLAESEEAVAFRRKDLSGRSAGARYRAEAGEIELLGDVYVRIEDEAQGATEIRARRMWGQRLSQEIIFQEEVALARGADSLRADMLTLGGGEERLDSARAEGAVVLLTHGDPRLATGAQPPGPRELRCQQLDIFLREDRSLERAVANGQAELRAMPGPREAPETRVLAGETLTFWWDEQGRLASAMGGKGASLALEPAGRPEGARRVEARNITVQIEPESGQVREAQFRSGVVFSQREQRATSERASFDGPSAVLTLFDGPRLEDGAAGTVLTAAQVEIRTASGAVEGRHNVQHTLERPGLGALLGGEAPVLIAARFFSYTPAAREARYSGTALLRSGGSEVRAREIRLSEGEGGQRRLEASGAVQASLAARTGGAGAAAGPASEAQADELCYDQAARRIVYRGGVRLRQGIVEIRAPEATATLDAKGEAVERLEAGVPVEVLQGARRVTGGRMRYTPADGAVAVEGEKVELVEGTQRVQGRSLIFYTGDDRILVDGREEARTETVLRRNPQKP